MLDSGTKYRICYKRIRQTTKEPTGCSARVLWVLSLYVLRACSMSCMQYQLARQATIVRYQIK